MIKDLDLKLDEAENETSPSRAKLEISTAYASICVFDTQIFSLLNFGFLNERKKEFCKKLRRQKYMEI